MNKRMYLIIFVVLTVLVVSLLAWFISGQEDTAETMTSNKSDQIDQVNSPKLNANLSETQVLQRIKDSHARRKLVSLDEDKLRAGIFQSTNVLFEYCGYGVYV